MARRRQRQEAPPAGLRELFASRLQAMHAILAARDGTRSLLLDEAYGFYRLTDLANGRPVEVLGFEVSHLLPLKYQLMIDPLDRLILTPEGTLIPG